MEPSSRTKIYRSACGCFKCMIKAKSQRCSRLQVERICEMYQTLQVHGGNELLNLSCLIIYSFAVKRRGCFTRISSPLIRRLENIRCGEPLPTYFQVNRDVGVRVMAGTKVAQKKGAWQKTHQIWWLKDRAPSKNNHLIEFLSII